MKCSYLPLAFAAAFCVPAAAMHYDINVGIRPEAHRLDATVIVRDPPSERFVLYKNFAIRSVLADGKPVAFRIDRSASPSPFTPEGAVVVAESKGAKVIEVRYGGTIDKPISDVNMITPALVELALPSAWYPFFSMNDYTFRLTASLPEGLTVAANAKLKSQATDNGRTTFVWTSYAPSFDIALLAAPGLHATAAGSPRVEIDYADMPAATMDALRDALIEARTRLTAHYGVPHANTALQVVYAPRGGYPYARPPLVLTSETFVPKTLEKGEWQVELFHWDAHELAHAWWTIGQDINNEDWTNNCDAWIDEGLAEFSALRLVGEQYGEPAQRKILDQYRQEAAQGKTGDAIAETKQNSRDFFLNRYKKVPLMLFAAREKFGEARLDAFLRALHARFAGTHEATTARFLDLAQKEMGADAADFFRQELYRRAVAAQP